MCPFPSVVPFGTSKKPSVGTAPRYGHCLHLTDWCLRSFHSNAGIFSWGASNILPLRTV